ncbi:hypothetical protein [Nocardia sp. SSK8]
MSYVIAMASTATILAMAVSGYLATQARRAPVRVRVRDGARWR